MFFYEGICISPPLLSQSLGFRLFKPLRHLKFFELLDNFKNNSLEWDIEPTLTRPDLPGNTLTNSPTWTYVTVGTKIIMPKYKIYHCFVE